MVPQQPFEDIKKLDNSGNEYWSARELSKLLEYSEYRHFVPVLEKAKEACLQSGHNTEDHFEEIIEMVEIGSGAKRKLKNIALRLLPRCTKWRSQ